MQVYKRRVKGVLFFIFLILILVGIFLVPLVIKFFSQAGLAEPQALVLGNLSPTSVTIVWFTKEPAQGDIIWGVTRDLGQVSHDMRKSLINNFGETFTHVVKLDNLVPGTSYYFRVVTNGKVYPPEKEAPYLFQTPSVESQQLSSPLKMFGEVAGGSYDYVVVVAPIGSKVYPFVAPVTPDGTWYVDVSSSYTYQDLRSVIFDQSAKFNVFALGKVGDFKGGVTTASSPIKLNPSTTYTASSMLSALGLPKVQRSAGGTQNIAQAPSGTEKTTPSPSKKAPVATSTGTPSPTPTSGGPVPTVTVSPTGAGENQGQTPAITGAFPLGAIPTGLTPTPTGSTEEGVASQTPTPSAEDKEQSGSSSFKANIYGLKLRFISPSDVRQDLKLATDQIKQTEKKGSNNRLATGQKLEFGDELSYPLVVNVSESSATIIWRTVGKVPTHLELLSGGKTKTFDDERGEGDFYFHVVRLRYLTPGQQYRYKIGASEFTFTAPQTLKTPPSLLNLSGIVSGQGDECLVLAQVKRDSAKSALGGLLTTANVAWSLDIGALRTVDYLKYFEPKDTDYVELSVYCVDSSGKLYKGNVTKQVGEVKDVQVVIEL